MPIVGWIDFSSEYRNRTMKMLDLLKEQGTLDELGIGVVRDAFADFFFPGTSTLQTRAKYFLQIPWIIQDLENKCTPSRDFIKKLQETELKFVEIFEASSPGAPGIIGSVSRDSLKRKPSELYWRGLATYSILPNPNLSLSQHAQLLDARYQIQKQIKTQRSSPGDDVVSDDQDIDKDRIKPWHLLPPPPDWQQRLPIDLSFDEASFLRETVIHARPDTLFSHILRDHLFDCLDCESIGQLPFLSELPHSLQKMIQMATDFSFLMEGAHIRFNIMIQASRGEQANLSFNDDFECWLAGIRQFPWQRWDTYKLQHDLNLSSQLIRFIQSWIECVHAGNWPDADSLIKHREWNLKHSRSKLANPSKTINQHDWVGIRRLVYRWPDVKRHIIDIADGLHLEVSHA